LIFEYDLVQHGGIFKMVKGSSYEGTFFLNFKIYFHTIFSITSARICIIPIIFSLLRFDKNPRPNFFS
jgi:hypothetical protein